MLLLGQELWLYKILRSIEEASLGEWAKRQHMLSAWPKKKERGRIPSLLQFTPCLIKSSIHAVCVDEISVRVQAVRFCHVTVLWFPLFLSCSEAFENLFFYLLSDKLLRRGRYRIPTLPPCVWGLSLPIFCPILRHRYSRQQEKNSCYLLFLCCYQHSCSAPPFMLNHSYSLSMSPI